MIGTILGNVRGITLELDVETKLVSLDGYFCGSNDGKLDRLFLEESLGSTDYKLLCSDEGKKLRSSRGKVLGTIIGNLYVITLGIDF